jgi:hypothetical protein
MDSTSGGTLSSPRAGLPIYQASGETDPPSYSHARPERTASRQRAEHAYHLTNSKNKPWATLKFQSAARCPEHVPILFEGDVITGTLELDVQKDHVLEISIVVT